MKIVQKLDIEGYQTYQKYAGQVAPGTALVGKRIIDKFIKHLNAIEKFRNMNPDEIIAFQKKHRKLRDDDEFTLLDILKNWVQGHDYRYRTKRNYYSVVKSFFAKNRAPLPYEIFKIRTNKPTTQGELPLADLKKLILRLDPCGQAVFLCMFQAGLDQEGLIYWSNNGLDDLKKQLKSDPDVIKINLPGRKGNKNITNYYTFIGKDAIEALKNWLKVRPEGTNSIFVNQRGKPVTKSGLYMVWLRNMRSLGLISPVKKGDLGHRTGKSVHELRDCFRSQWAKSEAKKEIAEFMMGHTIDPLGYNKSHQDTDFYKAEYLKALPHLNIMSSGAAFHQVPEEQLKTLQKKYAEQHEQIGQMLKELEALKGIIDRTIDKQIPNAEVAIGIMKKNPEENRRVEKDLDYVFGKYGPARDSAYEIAKKLKKRGVKKGRSIVVHPEAYADHPTFSQES